jgi:hypothetical protein
MRQAGVDERHMFARYRELHSALTDETHAMS